MQITDKGVMNIFKRAAAARWVAVGPDARNTAHVFAGRVGGVGSVGKVGSGFVASVGGGNGTVGRIGGGQSNGSNWYQKGMPPSLNRKPADDDGRLGNVGGQDSGYLGRVT